MVVLILFACLFILILISIKNKITFDFRTFFRKGFKAKRGSFGLYCFVGKQGTGKTFNAVEFLARNSDRNIYSNIHLSKDINYKYYCGFDELLNINDKHCIIFYDEIFTQLTKSSKVTEDFLSFLSQQRKNDLIFITTAQEWLEIPLTLRRYVRYQIDCSIINVLPFSLGIEKYFDAENMKYDKEIGEYIAPIIRTKVKKMNKFVTQLYDTLEIVRSGR